MDFASCVDPMLSVPTLRPELETMQPAPSFCVVTLDFGLPMLHHSMGEGNDRDACYSWRIATHFKAAQ